MIDEVCRELFTDVLGQNGILRKANAVALDVARIQKVRIDQVVERMNRADVRMDFLEAWVDKPDKTEKPSEPQTEGTEKTGYDLAVEYVVEQISEWIGPNESLWTAQVKNIERMCECIPLEVIRKGVHWVLNDGCGYSRGTTSYTGYRRVEKSNYDHPQATQ